MLVRFLSGGSPLPISHALPIYTIMFYQHIIGLVLISVWMWRANEMHRKDFVTSMPWLHFSRIVTAALGIGFFYLSLRYIPVTQAVALSVTAPIFTTVGAVLFLKETFDLQRKMAVYLSIIGGILVARPDQALLTSAGYSWFMLLPVLAAIAFSVDKLITRKLLAHDEQPRTLAWYLLAFIAPLSLLPALFYGWVTPGLEHLPWLGILGLLGALAHYTFNKAYATAEVTILLPFGAARLLLGAILSYIAFYEIPKSFDMWLGIGIIIISTVILGLNKNMMLSMRGFQLSNKKAI
ncbi:MAG TPA: DMT family transporter [Gammaproteobacteria bacterium]|nr:DMT family transporter [Gammaproteobacteria bacterium]